ncbi:MAG: DUF1553 domain-containing protein, partial [Chthonomonadaceae bacterium]|nr:DUF1553 domain-containing protein [Chthonomonadaceae bacterium]
SIRDCFLSVGGLLSPKVGGPSVYPSQPEGVWDTPYNSESWMTSVGADRYRRGLYTFWKRSSPYPAFMAFDAPPRDTCTVRRTVTNTPLQALALLNDAVAVESASGLAKKMSKMSLRPGLIYGFRACTGRVPTRSEIDRLVKLAERVKARGGDHYQSVAIALLNLDETLCRN